MKTREDTEIVRFGPLRVLKWALDESTDELLGRAIRGDGALVLTHNLDHIRLARNDAALAASLNEAEITLADGVPLLWLASLAGDSLPGRVNGTDLMEELSRKAANVEVSAVLFGGRDGVAEEAGALLARTHPGLRVVDAFSPSDRLVSKPEEIEENLARIVAARPNLVFIGLPVGLQVSLGQRLRSELPTAVIVGVGASFSFITGEIRRAPFWAQRAGLEWLFRLVAEPRPLARRYLIHDLPVFIVLVASTIATRVRGIVNPAR